ncbi:hypothetical protein Pmani_018515 [Petrolisthes manimaculis]|uniref:EF-hand domain-containing protein n=1 Tax=Petrolisthes manimaculis TaxID=1843537 RepID=A0AAE1PK29_9EUCA|nr:hypothetical protein Pmani_018515 [Petrolisthes manimaculis]
MASAVRRGVMNARLCRHFTQRTRTFRTSAFHSDINKASKLSLYGSAAAISLYMGIKWMDKYTMVEAAKPSRRGLDDLTLRGLKLNHRERRFIKFASAEYQGQLYMTPQDFIESVTDSEPRPRMKRRVLRERDLEQFVQEVPLLSKGSPEMFRTIFDQGIISYTEYLFLLSILTKPQTGFRIAFNMFDTDGNQRVDKEEFLVLEKIFSTARRDRLNRALEGAVKAVDGDEGDLEEVVEDELQKRHVVDTTLLLHFFGRKGKQDLKFEEFKMFMENLQTEVLEIEFNEFSKGLPAITELDFAKILLRYTYLQSDQYEMYLERLLDRIPEGRGITFNEFKSFCQFLNTLDDFAIAMRMYTLADQPISQEEFHRAVKICTGAELSPHIVDTVFKIFDDDGDGQLSYKEFIAIMRDRLHRGFKHTSRSEGWEAFKQCVKRSPPASQSQQPREGWVGFKACVKAAMNEHQPQQPSIT